MVAESLQVLLELLQRVVLLQVVLLKVLDENQNEQVQHDEADDRDEAEKVEHGPHW